MKNYTSVNHISVPDIIRYFFFLFCFCNLIFYRKFSYIGIPFNNPKIYITEFLLLFFFSYFFVTFAIRPILLCGKSTLTFLFPLFSFWAWSIVAILYSDFNDLSFFAREFASVGYSFFAFITIFTVKSEDQFNQLVKIIIIGASLSLVVIYYRVLTGQGHFTTTGALRFGNYETVGLLFLINWIGTYKLDIGNIKSIVLWILKYISLLTIVVFIQHRSATIAVIFSILLFYCLNRQYLSKSQLRHLKISAGILAIIIVAYFSNNYLSSTIERLLSTIDGHSDSNISWRKQVLVHAFQSMNFLDYIIGKGWGELMPKMYFGGRTYSDGVLMGMHNSIMFYFYHIGTIGVFLFIWILFRIYKFALRTSKICSRVEASQLRALLSTNVGILIFALFNVVLEGPYMGSVFWVTLGMIVVKCKLINKVNMNIISFDKVQTPIGLRYK